jgi:Fis family transcriptional regulator
VYDFHPEPSVTSQLVGLSVAEVERDLILETLKQTSGNRTHAASVLGISIRTMRNKLSDYASAGTVIPEAGTTLSDEH